MHLKIKPESEAVKRFYENHSSYHEGDSGLDLFVTERITIPGKSLSFKIDSGISCEAFIDKSKQTNLSYYLYPRSSMGAKTPLRLSNSVGIIDSGYRGNIIGIVDNLSDEDFIVEPGTRLFQLCSPILDQITFQIVNSLSDTSRGGGGLGSTGN
tara:strand:- start:6025 stop:6486 length:462 start_codon:yes stop_codon:yes gene_type:complete